MRLAVGEHEPALRDGPADGGAVRQDELHLPLRCEADGLPHLIGEERVGRAAVNEEANAGFLAGKTADGALDVADTRAPQYGILVTNAVIRRLREGQSDARGGQARPAWVPLC